MTLAEFNHSVNAAESPPEDLPPALQALWWCAKGDWSRAHAVAQDSGSSAGSWVHAHLHRVEGDEDNAAYWYAKAARPVVRGDLHAERDAIVAALLKTT